MTPPAASARPRVAVFTLGGTIASTGGSGTGIAPSLSGAQLLAAVPGLDRVADIIVDLPLQIPGASLGLDDLIRIAGLVTGAIADGASGAVVVQGTDTIEDTAFVLDCLLDTDRPVVVTGAMRGPEAAGADGPANLLAAATVAASGVHGTGTVVVLGDEVHAARFARKGHTGLPSAFVSDPFGPLGHVIEGRFRPGWTVPPRPALRPAADAIPPVALVQIGLGDDARMIDALSSLGYRGAVILGLGAGHVPRDLAAPLGALAEQMPVVLSTRVAGGPVFRATYGFAGSEIDLLGRG